MRKKKLSLVKEVLTTNTTDGEALDGGTWTMTCPPCLTFTCACPPSEVCASNVCETGACPTHYCPPQESI